MASRNAVASTSRLLHTSSRISIAAKNSRMPGPKAGLAKNSKAGGSVTADTSSSSVRVAPNQEFANASVETSHLDVLSKNKMRESDVGKALVFAEDYSRSVLSASLPKSLRKDLSYTTRPTTVLRRATATLVRKLDSGKGGVHILAGKPGSGRSTILLQAMASCASSGWLVLYVPDAHQLINASSGYTPNGSDKDVRYEQNEAAQDIIQKFLAINSAHLSKMDSTLAASLKGAAKDPGSATNALQSLLNSSTLPLLLAVDGVEALYRPSAYLDANAKPIPAKQLAIPNLLLSYVSGKSKISTGAVVAALNKTSALPSGPVSEATQVPVNALDRTEAAGIFAHLAEMQLLGGALCDTAFLENYVASDGNAYLFTRGLRAIPGGTSRGVLKKGRSRGVSQRADKLLTVTV